MDQEIIKCWFITTEGVNLKAWQDVQNTTTHGSMIRNYFVTHKSINIIKVIYAIKRLLNLILVLVKALYHAIKYYVMLEANQSE